MKEFFIEANLELGKARIHVIETTSEDQAEFQILLYTIYFYNGLKFITMTLQLEDGKWFDPNTRLSEDDYYLRYDVIGMAWNAEYQSPLNQRDIDKIGSAIANLMILLLTRQMNLFKRVLPNHILN